MNETVTISLSCLDTIRNIARDGGIYETGGNLAGIVEGAVIRVVAASSPGPRAEREATTLLLSGIDTADWLEEVRRKDSRLRYLGDWHTHLLSVSPSFLDVEAIARMAKYEPFEWPSPLSFIFRPRRFLVAEVLAGYRYDGATLVPIPVQIK